MLPNLPPPLPGENSLKQSEPNLNVTLEFMAEQDGVLGGRAQVVTFLRALSAEPFEIWLLESGAALKRGDVVMRLRGRFHLFGAHANAIAGVLASCSGWTTFARKLVEAAKPLPVIFRSARTAHAAVLEALERAAVEGGCLPAASEWNRGLAAREFVLLKQDTLRALRAFDATLPQHLPRLTYVDLFHAEADDAVRVALASRNKLNGVVLQMQSDDAAQTLERIKRVHSQLEYAGFPRVKIFLEGMVTPEQIEWFKTKHAPLDGYFVGDQIGAAPPLLFAIELREQDERPIGRRGQTPGVTTSLRLQRVAWKET